MPRRSVAADLMLRTLTHKLATLRLAEEEAAELLAILDDARADLVDLLRTRWARVPSPDSRVGQHVAYLQQVAVELGELERAVATASWNTLGGDLERFAAREVEWYGDMMQRVLPFAWSPTLPAPSTLVSLVRDDPFRGRLLRDHVEKLGADRVATVMTEVRRGVVQGMDMDTMTTRALGAFDGRRHHAESVVRTATMHITESARERLLTENDDLVRGLVWTATLDHRTCPICMVRDTKAWTLKGKRPIGGHGLPWLDGPGRAHFRCRCSAVPLLRMVDELAENFDLERLSESERAALGDPLSTGPVPGRTEYRDWIKGQSREIRQSALGRQRALWWEANPEADLEQVLAQRFALPTTVVPSSRFQNLRVPDQAVATSYLRFESPGELDLARTWWNQQAAPWSPRGNEDAALNYYTGDGFFELNRALRTTGGEVPDNLSETVSAMDSALARSRLPEPVVVWRGMDSRLLDAVQVGDVLTDHAYLSTSAMRASTPATGAVVEIRLPADYRGALWLAPRSRNPEELEVLLSRGLRLRVVEVRESVSTGLLRTRQKHVVVEVMSDE